MPVEKQDWVWYGSPGHLCIRSKCQFHLCTKVGPWLVSTIGEYFPGGAETAEEIGSGRKYETKVFEICGECPCGCGLPDITGVEVEGVSHKNAKAANEGHLEMCEEFSQREE